MNNGYCELEFPGWGKKKSDKITLIGLMNNGVMLRCRSWLGYL